MRECQQQKMPTESLENIDYKKQLKADAKPYTVY